MTYAIIGAGPAGLYAAIKLKQLGIEDVVVFDRRANQYTRPGHLTYKTFQNVEMELNILFSNKDTHIKSLERALYKEAVRLGVRFENKQFLRLHRDATEAGVIVSDGENEEKIKAEYVFDCTGTNRSVVTSVNELVPDEPFKLTPVVDPMPVKTHMVAYVRLDESKMKEMGDHLKYYLDPETIDPLHYAQSILKLSELGWNDLFIPRCYGVAMGKGKACLYLHAPDNLPKEKYDEWLSTVLSCYINPSSYAHLPEMSKTNRPKRNITTFPMQIDMLNQSIYQGKDLSTVIALGDAQIGADYALSHGIRNGFDRIDVLFNVITLTEDDHLQIKFEEYNDALSYLYRKHINDVIVQADALFNRIHAMPNIAAKKLESAYQGSQDETEKASIKSLLQNVNAYRCAKIVMEYCSQQKDSSNLPLLNKFLQALEPLTKRYSSTNSQQIKDQLDQLMQMLTEEGNKLSESSTLPSWMSNLWYGKSMMVILDLCKKLASALIDGKCAYKEDQSEIALALLKTSFNLIDRYAPQQQRDTLYKEPTRMLKKLLQARTSEQSANKALRVFGLQATQPEGNQDADFSSELNKPSPK